MSGFTFNRGPPTPPPPARAHGYNRRVFFDDFNFSSTVYVSTSGATTTPGYNWYRSALNSSVIASSAITVANSLITIASDSSGNRGFVTSVGWDNTTPVSTFYASGFTVPLGRGAYIVTSISFLSSQNSSDTGSLSWPAQWSKDINLEIQEMSHVGIIGTRGNEIDFNEAVPNGTGGTNQTMNVFAETVTSSSGHAVIDQTQSNPTSSFGFNFNNQNSFGTLCLPMARNGGTGILKRYWRDTHIPSFDLTWTAGSSWAFLENMNMFIFLWGGFNWPSNTDYVSVWCPP